MKEFIIQLTYLKKGGKTMAYTKPMIVAQNATVGSYAAGCPAEGTETDWHCKQCERTS